MFHISNNFIGCYFILNGCGSFDVQWNFVIGSYSKGNRIQYVITKLLNPFTGEFMVTVSDINGLFFLFFLYKIHSKTGISIVY